MVKIKNIGNEPLAFTGFPILAVGETIEVTQEEADILLLNDSVELVGGHRSSRRGGSVKGIEAE